MATENDDSRSMNGILSNISRDVVDTSWDIPPLTFPKLQPTDSEEADGADEASLAEPRTIASSVPAQTEQPVSAAPTIADIPSMPLDTIDFDDAVAPADAEETATLPPLVSSTDEQDVEATQAFDTSGGITDLEELAAEDPEHDPLKTIPVAPKEPSADKRKIIAIVAAIAAVAVAIAGVIVVRNRINSKEQRAAVVVCEKAKSKYSKANEKLQNAIEQATSLQGTANQVADAATIDQLTQAVTKAQNLKTVGGCSVLLSETTLRAHARSMSKQISNIKEQTKAVTAAATAVDASKRALEVNKTTAALQKAIADAKTLLDGSAGEVADESTRDALAKAIDAAQKLLDGKSTDVTAMQNASKVISSTSDGVNKSVAEQTAANAQSNTNSNTNNGTTNRRYTYTWQFGPGSGNGVNGGGSTGGNNNGGSTGGNGDSTGNGNGGSTGGNGGSNDGNGGSTGGNGDSNGNGGSTGGNGGNGDSNDNGNGGSDGGNDNSDTGTAGE